MYFFLGSVYPPRLFEYLVSKKQFVDYPANVFQQSLLKGLDYHIADLRVITSPVIRSPFFTANDLFTPSFFSHRNSNDSNAYYVGTVPIPGIQILVEFWRVFRTLKKELKLSQSKNRIIIYALHSPFLLSAVLLRNHIDCSCVVVPDLPEFMSNNHGLFRRTVKRIDRRIIIFCLKRVGCFVLLSPYMRERLPIKNKPWVLMEGIYDTSSLPVEVEKTKERTILYSGNLSRRYGIVQLLEAFHQIEKDNYRLWICGSGEAKDDVLDYVKNDKRIRYWGVVSHDEVLVLQQQATILINPRNCVGEYTKYSFPSKTMEYLASGTPTIMYHLPAIPKEYDDFLFYITEDGPKGIKNRLIDVCERPQQELDAFGQKAAEFVRSKKNAYIQARKVKDIIDSVR